MVRKYCVSGCRSNYDSNDKITVFRLPRDKEERQRWKKAIPRDNIPDHPNTVVCIKHFPEGFETVSVKGSLRPKHPPSIFCNLPKSLIPTPVPLARTTSKSSSSVRSVQNDELEAYSQNDIVSFDTLCSFVGSHSFTFPFSVSAFRNDDLLCIQSTDHLTSSSIPRFLLTISPDQSFQGFHAGVKVWIKSLSSNKIVKLNRWSQIQEALRYLNSLDLDHKQTVLLEQCVSLNTTRVGTLKYSTEIILRAFEYFATSRSLYNQLRKDVGLPILATLNRLSS
ncbi:THAP domaincontaining protein 5like [acyrthosiphon pisum] [Plakobranchus ocellatus]|uniref:THAP domaincontaining protein 5like [acyrthosiphon pisum] n=1 Tax=Plakobranchus ocellatus TaxID=259542 RepID=A0AAV4D0E3_9GAST|nr:THAP domaincontaining protein 5like [acyrthosiphon pisum] [Plakobranchus ocellatus]